MKTVQDWQDQWHLGRLSLVELIAAIQQDAYKSGLLRAAQVCRERYPNTFQAKGRAFAAEACAQSIEAEAKKGLQ